MMTKQKVKCDTEIRTLFQFVLFFVDYRIQCFLTTCTELLFAIGTQEQCVKVIEHLERILKVNVKLLSRESKRRRIPRQVECSLTWLKCRFCFAYYIPIVAMSIGGTWVHYNNTWNMQPICPHSETSVTELKGYLYLWGSNFPLLLFSSDNLRFLSNWKLFLLWTKWQFNWIWTQIKIDCFF